MIKRLLSTFVVMLCVLVTSAADNVVAVKNAVFETVFGEKNSEVYVPVGIINEGDNGFDNIGITIDVNGTKEHQTVQVGYTIQGAGGEYYFDLNVKTMPETGVSNVTITVDEVNGMPNTCSENIISGKMVTLSRKAFKKVVLEEFTALWCKSCPRGLVGLQKLREKFGDDVVLISVHRGDPMECDKYSDIITHDYPDSHMDRTYMDIDPWHGTGKNGLEGIAFQGYGLAKDVEALQQNYPSAEVKVEGNIDGNTLKVKATTKFLYTGEANHALVFVVTENGLHNEDWVQSNNLPDYKGKNWEKREPLLDKWINGERKVKNVIYDDVAVDAMDVVNGIDGSIPAMVNEGEALEYEVEFSLANKLIQDQSKLSVIAFVIDRSTGKIVNADCKKVGDITGIANVDSEDAVEVARYTQDGQKINAPQKGLNIVRYSDGTVKKIIL